MVKRHANPDMIQIKMFTVNGTGTNSQRDRHYSVNGTGTIQKASLHFPNFPTRDNDEHNAIMARYALAGRARDGETSRWKGC